MTTGTEAEQDRIRFIADNMLGRLARWLRIMGYDTVYVRSGEDSEIIRISESENRVILTRDRQMMMRRGVNAFFIEEIQTEKQLDSVTARFNLPFREDAMRCSFCNGQLHRRGKEELKDIVPEGVFERNELFYQCTSCMKVYWRGSHWKRIEQVIERATSH